MSVKIGVDISDVQELVKTIRELRAEMAAMGGGGVSGVNPGGIPGPSGGVGSIYGGGSAPAQPSVPATQLSPAATGILDPATVVPPVVPGQPGAVPGAASQTFMAGLTKTGLWAAGLNAAANIGAGYGSAVANGRPYYQWQEGVLDGLPLTAGLIGAGIGSFIPGAGTAVGGAVGLAVGFAAQSVFREPTERYVQDMELNRVAKLYGYIGDGDDLGSGMNKPAMNAMKRQIVSGRYLTKAANQAIRDAYGDDNGELQGMMMDALSDAAYSPAVIARYGKSMPDARTPKQRRDLLMADSFGKELERSAQLRAEGWIADAQGMERKYDQRVSIEGLSAVATARSSLSSTELSIASRYGTPDQALAAGRQVESRMQVEAQLMRQQAALMTDPSMQAATLARAQQMDLQSQYVAGEAYSQSLKTLNASITGLQYGRADREFGASRFSGARPENLPWESRVNAAEGEASRLEKERESIRAVRPLSQAEENEYSNRIEGARYNARIGIAKEREDSVNSQKMADADLYGATVRNQSMRASLYGSIGEQATAGVDAELKATQERLRVLQEILSTSRMLTSEQRTQLQTQTQALQADQERLNAQKLFATVDANLYSGSNAQSIATSKAMVNTLQGPGGVASLEEGLKTVAAAETNLGVRIQERQRLIDSGVDPTNKKVTDLDDEIEQRNAGIVQSKANLSVFTPSHETTIRGARIDTAIMQARLGFETYGYGKQAIRAGMENNTREFHELQAWRTRLAGENEDGKLTPLQERNLSLQEEALKQKQLGYGEMYLNGWQDRVLSQAFGTPGNGRVAISLFNPMTATRNGVQGAWLGGDERTTREYREFIPTMMMGMGSGNPRNQPDRFFADGERMSMPGGSSGGGSQTNVKVQVEFVNSPNGSQPRVRGIEIGDQRVADALNPVRLMTPRPSG